MIDVQVDTVINKPLGEVFDFVKDEANMPRWDDDLVKATKTSDGPTQKGSTFHLDIKPFMGQTQGDGEVVGYEEGRLVELKFHMGKFHPHVFHMFEAQGDATKFTRKVQIEPPGLMRLMAPMITKRITKQNVRYLAKLKSLVESSA